MRWKMNKYAEYERVKERLQKLNLPPQEYEKRLREIARRLKI